MEEHGNSKTDRALPLTIGTNRDNQRRVYRNENLSPCPLLEFSVNGMDVFMWKNRLVLSFVVYEHVEEESGSDGDIEYKV